MNLPGILDGVTAGELMFFLSVFVGFLLAIYFAEIA